MKFFEQLKINRKEKKTEIQPPEFELEVFKDARKNFEDLTRELIPAIQNHEYNLIIGDDTSGRLTTRVIEGLLREVYQEDEVEPPQVLFFPGGCDIDSRKDRLTKHFQELIKKKINPLKTKALLTTEFICSGHSASIFSQVLKEAGLSCDIAALGYSSSFKDIKREYKNLKKIRIYNGGFGLHFWPRRDLAGVEKHRREIFSSRKEEDRERVLASRRDVKKMANYLKQIYDREKEKTGK